MSANAPISLTVTYRGTPYSLSLLPDSTLAALQVRLEELTSVPPSLQKLLYKGKKSSSGVDDETTLSQTGYKHGMKISMLGPTAQELRDIQAVESERKKRDLILRERALKAPTKVRSTGSSNTVSLKYRFHQLTPLSHLPNPESALALLKKLSEDAAIKHVMQMHEFSVGVLTELAPHEHPGLLGLNTNYGLSIKLRLRTDKYDGFRMYTELRRVLCHELAHNVFGDHDNDFKELNSKLNREVLEFERRVSEGTHHLYPGEVHEPASELEVETHVHILGGNHLSSAGGSETREERRNRLLEATMFRLRKEEEELEDSCGTGHSV